MSSYVLIHMFLYITLYYTPFYIYAIYTAGRLSSSSRSLPPVPADPLTGHFKYVSALAEDRKNEMESYPSTSQSNNLTSVSIYKYAISIYTLYAMYITCMCMIAHLTMIIFMYTPHKHHIYSTVCIYILH